MPGCFCDLLNSQLIKEPRRRQAVMTPLPNMQAVTSPFDPVASFYNLVILILLMLPHRLTYLPRYLLILVRPNPALLFDSQWNKYINARITLKETKLCEISVGRYYSVSYSS